MIELITGVVTDTDNHVLFARSQKHGWWELPGTKLRDPWVPREVALRDALRKKLAIEAVAVEDAMPNIKTIDESVAGLEFRADVRRVLVFSGFAMETSGSGYSEISWVDTTLRKLGKMGLSPITERFLEPCRDDPSWLQAIR